MSYTPTTWTSGDIVTSAKLNKIENGIVEASSSGGVEIYTGTLQEGTDNGNSVHYATFPITYGQVYQKMNDGILIILKIDYSYDDDPMVAMALIPEISCYNGEEYYIPINSNETLSHFLYYNEGAANMYVGTPYDEEPLPGNLDPSDPGTGDNVVK